MTLYDGQHSAYLNPQTVSVRQVKHSPQAYFVMITSVAMHTNLAVLYVFGLSKATLPSPVPSNMSSDGRTLIVDMPWDYERNRLLSKIISSHDMHVHTWLNFPFRGPKCLRSFVFTFTKSISPVVVPQYIWSPSLHIWCISTKI